MKYKIGLAIVLVFAVMQLFVAEEVAYEEPTQQDFLAMEQAPEEVALMIKTICYDCHSNQITYPWYSKIAPVSWWLADHIEHGREHLNFSEWGAYNAEKKEHKAEECWEEVEEEEMPLTSYILVHRAADLSDEQRSKLIDYFKSIEEKY